MPFSLSAGLSKLFRLRLLLVVNALLCVAVVVSFGREWWRDHLLAEEIERVERRASEIQGAHALLSQDAAKLAGAAFIENEARTKLHLQKPGETLYVISHPEEAWNGLPIDHLRGGAHPSQTQVPNAFPARWWAYFFGDHP